MLLSAFTFEGVIVDLDGTLVDTLDDFVAALNLMRGELRLTDVVLTRAMVEPLVGKGSAHLINAVLKSLEVQQETGSDATNSVAKIGDALLAESAFAVYQKHYQAVNGKHSTVYPGVLRALDGFKNAGLQLACVTNKPVAFAQTLLKLKSLDGYFSCVFGGDSFAQKKPDPMPLIKACETLGIAPRRTLMIGDSVNDALAARAAGCAVVLVTYGYNHGRPIRDVDADAFVDGIDELLEPRCAH